MHVVYKSTVEKVNDVISHAQKQQRKIDYIELAPPEWFDFRKDTSTRLFDCLDTTTTDVQYHGVEIRRGK